MERGERVLDAIVLPTDQDVNTNINKLLADLHDPRLSIKYNYIDSCCSKLIKSEETVPSLLTILQSCFRRSHQVGQIIKESINSFKSLNELDEAAETTLDEFCKVNGSRGGFRQVVMRTFKIKLGLDNKLASTNLEKLVNARGLIMRNCQNERFEEFLKRLDASGWILPRVLDEISKQLASRKVRVSKPLSSTPVRSNKETDVNMGDPGEFHTYASGKGEIEFSSESEEDPVAKDDGRGREWFQTGPSRAAQEVVPARRHKSHWPTDPGATRIRVKFEDLSDPEDESMRRPGLFRATKSTPRTFVRQRPVGEDAGYSDASTVSLHNKSRRKRKHINISNESGMAPGISGTWPVMSGALPVGNEALPQKQSGRTDVIILCGDETSSASPPSEPSGNGSHPDQKSDGSRRRSVDTPIGSMMNRSNSKNSIFSSQNKPYSSPESVYSHEIGNPGSPMHASTPDDDNIDPLIDPATPQDTDMCKNWEDLFELEKELAARGAVS